MVVGGGDVVVKSRYVRDMANKRMVLMAVALVTGCGSDSAPPSCQQSLTHYYASGCMLIDLSSGNQIPRDQEIAACQSALSGAPAKCALAFDQLRVCWDSVINHATTSADCDCSQEQDAVSSCQ